MARTTVSDVTDAIDTDLSNGQVSEFIDDANSWVTDELTGEGLSTDRLTLIEKYLACHFVTLRDPRLRRASVEDVSENYQRDREVTEYLKTAAALDPTGAIRGEFMGKKQARFRVSEGYDDDLDLAASG